VSHSTILGLIMAVPLLTWLGVFLYLINIDRTLQRLESTRKEQDDL